MQTNSDADEDLGPFQITSRREIFALMKSLRDRKQLVRMVYHGGSESVITSVIEVDDASNSVIFDSAPGRMQNERIVGSSNLSFETMLDKIRILFFATEVHEVEYDGRSALMMALPATMVRLQRREYFRVITPRCSMFIPCGSEEPQVEGEPELTPETVQVSVKNVSGGGLAFVDDKLRVEANFARVYHNCRIDIPGGTPIIASIEIRNWEDARLPNGKVVRRFGALFVDLPKASHAAIQRFITQLERDQNARSNGLA